MSTTTKTVPLNTRHYGMIAIGVISALVTVLGTAQGNIPQFSTYLEATAIPDIITIADWVAARIQSGKGLGSISFSDIQTLITTVEDLKSKFPVIQKPAVAPATPSTTSS